MSSTSDQIRYRKLLQARKALRPQLPHLYGWPWYQWAWDFFNAANPHGHFLCAGNQVTKSSTQIRKNIEWATNRTLWKKLWPRRPLQFWYLYPSLSVAKVEFEKKWVPEFMPGPRNGDGTPDFDPYEGWDHPYYGWEVEKKQGGVEAIHWRSGVSTYWRSYEQDIKNLQSGSVDSIFCDEELPEEIFDELTNRLEGRDGYFHMVFTATIGQELWRLTIQPEKGEKEQFPEAWKRQISKEHDCRYYMDGTPSKWTPERVALSKAKCRNSREVDKRVHGKFVKTEGLLVDQFSRGRNVVAPYPIWKGARYYAGVDIGSGGEKNHPSAITIIAVRPDFLKGAVIRHWNGAGVETTSATTFEKFREMSHGLPFSGYVYDYSSPDFGQIANASGVPFMAANKNRDQGFSTLNSLYKQGVLDIFDLPECRPLILEHERLHKDTPKTKAKDDSTDSTRYPVVFIPWDWARILPVKPEKFVVKIPTVDEERAMDPDDEFRTGSDEIGDEIDEWNREMGAE